jgi:hypothetical protein
MPPATNPGPSGDIPNTQAPVLSAEEERKNKEPSQGDPNHSDIDDIELNLNQGKGPNDSPAPFDLDPAAQGKKPAGVDPRTGQGNQGNDDGDGDEGNDGNETDEGNEIKREPGSDISGAPASGLEIPGGANKAPELAEVPSIKNLGKKILEAAMAEVRGVKLDDEDKEIAERASTTIAVESMMSFGMTA